METGQSTRNIRWILVLLMLLPLALASIVDFANHELVQHDDVDVDAVPQTDGVDDDLVGKVFPDRTTDQRSPLIRQRRSIVDWDRRSDKNHALTEVSYDLIVSELPESYRVRSKKRKHGRTTKPEKVNLLHPDQLGQVSHFSDREKRSSEDSASADSTLELELQHAKSRRRQQRHRRKEEASRKSFPVSFEAVVEEKVPVNKNVTEKSNVTVSVKNAEAKDHDHPEGHDPNQAGISSDMAKLLAAREELLIQLKRKQLESQDLSEQLAQETETTTKASGAAKTTTATPAKTATPATAATTATPSTTATPATTAKTGQASSASPDGTKKAGATATPAPAAPHATAMPPKHETNDHQMTCNSGPAGSDLSLPKAAEAAAEPARTMGEENHRFHNVAVLRKQLLQSKQVSSAPANHDSVKVEAFFR